LTVNHKNGVTLNCTFSRRDLLKNTAIVALIIAADKNVACAQSHRGEVAEWAKNIRLASDRLLNREMSPEQWQTHISGIYKKTNFGDLLKSLDFDAVKSGMNVGRPGGHWNQVFVTGLSTKSNKTKIITKIVGIGEGRSVPPHGHENEVSAFLTLSGKFRVKQWDRTAINKDSLDIIPVFDGISVPGQWNSQSEKKTNIHWLLNKTNDSFFLSIRVAKVDGTDSGRERILIDPDEASEIRKGVLRAPIIDRKTWWKKYSRI
jgi:hypothetical protein